MEPSGLGVGFGMACALLSALVWTLMSMLARDLTTRFPSFALNVIRSAGGSILLVPIALAFGSPRALAQVSALAWICLMISVLTALGIGDTAFFESTKYLGLGRAMTISTAGYPFLASVLALWWFGERITLTVAVGSLVTLAGLALIVSEGGIETAASPESRRRGLRLAVIAAMAWAIGAALMKPPVEEIDPLTIQAVRLPLSTLVLWATPWARGTARGLWAQRQIVGRRVVLLSVMTALTAVTYLAGLKYAGVALGTVLSSVSPLFALPVGFLAFGERVTWRAATGAALAVAGIAILSR
ncbi:MAG TPA: DMT family transporter [Methylomirabilota bacterium]